MYRILYLLLFLSVLTSCCNEEGVETHRYALSDIEKQLIPYNASEKISWTHSSGYEFSMDVSKCTQEWKEYHRFCEYNCCGQDYYSYEVKQATLEATYPRLQIEITVGEQYEEHVKGIILFQINNQATQLFYNEDGDFPQEQNLNLQYYDSLSINDKVFYGVKEQQFLFDYTMTDTTQMHIKSILFNDYGLLQIKLSNNENFSVDFN